CPTVEGARGRELAVEAHRRGQRAREPRVAGDRPGKLLSPSKRRRAVAMCQERFGMSARRACTVIGQHRSTQTYRPATPDPDRDLRVELRRFARRHPRWGYRRAHAVLVREGHHVNRKKIQRLWREEGLRVAGTPQTSPRHQMPNMAG